MNGLLEDSKRILVTGAAGFIGSYLCRALLEKNIEVVGIDNLNDYYDIDLKYARLREIEKMPGFTFEKCDIAESEAVENIMRKYKPEIIVNLAAQAGVRYSIINPRSYIDSNIIGFFNVLEACRHSRELDEDSVKHLVFASSSSVYGVNKKVPYSVNDKTDNPVSLYAATKKSDEMMAYSYSKLYGISVTGLRFFTVYGPLGRPDMAYFSFTNKMVKGERIQIFNYGDMYRDFTYIDDIIGGILRIMNQAPALDENGACYKIYNVGNSKPVSLMHFVEILENCLLEEGVITKTEEKELLPMQPGDVYQTYADVSELEREFHFKPDTELETGLRKFAKWYKEYYGI